MPRAFSNILVLSDLSSGPGQGLGRLGPPGPPGPVFQAGLDVAGDNRQQTVVGFRTKPLSAAAPELGQAYVFNGTLYEPQTPTGGLVPFTRTVYVDATTSVLAGNGSMGSPFSSLQDALDEASTGGAATSWHILLGPGIYSEPSFSVAGGRRVVVEGCSAALVVIQSTGPSAPGVEIQAADAAYAPSIQTTFTFRNVSISGPGPGVSVTPTTADPESVDLVFEGTDTSGVTGSASSPAVPTSCSGTDSGLGDVAVSGSVDLALCDVASVQCAAFSLRECVVSGALSASSDCYLVACDFSSGISVDVGSSRLVMDGPTSGRFFPAGCTMVTGSPLVADRQHAIKDYTTAPGETAQIAIGFLAGLPFESVTRSMLVDVSATATGQSTGSVAGFRRAATFKGATQLGSESDLLTAREIGSWDFSLASSDPFLTAVLTGDGSESVDWSIDVRRAFSPYVRF